MLSIRLSEIDAAIPQPRPSQPDLEKATKVHTKLRTRPASTFIQSRPNLIFDLRILASQFFSSNCGIRATVLITAYQGLAAPPISASPSSRGSARALTSVTHHLSSAFLPPHQSGQISPPAPPINPSFPSNPPPSFRRHRSHFDFDVTFISLSRAIPPNGSHGIASSRKCDT